MGIYNREAREFNSIAELKSITTQPNDNDLFMIVDDNVALIYNYEANGTKTEDGLNVLDLNNFAGKFYLINKKNTPSWIEFVSRPSTEVSTSSTGTIKKHTKTGENDVYRFIPIPYDATLDAFYHDVTLTQLIITRG